MGTGVDGAALVGGECGFWCGSISTYSHAFFFVLFVFRDTPWISFAITVVGGDEEVATTKEWEEEGDDPDEPGDV